MSSRVIALLKDGRIFEEECATYHLTKIAVNSVKQFEYGDFIAVIVIRNGKVIRLEIAE